MAENLHKGHRQRLKQQFLEGGIERLNDHQVLEMLLFYSIPQKDTNELAHRLIQRFGSLSGVLDATPEILCEVTGVSQHTATFLTFCRSLLNRYYQVKNSDVKILSSYAAIGRYLHSFFINERNEKVVLLCLNNRQEMLYCGALSEGSLTETTFSIRRVVQIALQCGATAAVLAHNHPAGLAMPSKEDVFATRQVANALKGIGVQLLDHLVFAQDDYTSMRQTSKFSGALLGGEPYAEDV